ncbi:MAG: PDZ domain-containing protein [Planctomycetota bacterium]|nr:PDZ domain-containing protein [Planctomycetota bacterium]
MTDASDCLQHMSCAEARELLSDLMDVRRGEVPQPEATRLAQPGMRAAVEQHLAGCDACREELRILGEIGAAFAAFPLDGVPAQHFDNYGKVVRARMARAGGAAQASAWRPRGVRVYGLTFGVSALAAASLFLVLTRGLLPLQRGAEQTVANTPIARAIPLPTGGGGMVSVLAPGRDLAQMVDLGAPTAIKNLQETEGRCGYLVFGEASSRPLLGAYLKTTRDVDRAVDERLGLMVYDVVPGSPAHMMGLKKNDYIVTVNGTPVENGGAEDAANFLAGIATAGAGTPIKLHIVRNVNSEPLFIVKEGVLGHYGP